MSAAGAPSGPGRRSPVPRFACPDCGRLIATTTPYAFFLPGGGTYHYLRPHQRPDRTPCPAASVRHPRHLALVPGGAEGAGDGR